MPRSLPAVLFVALTSTAVGQVTIEVPADYPTIDDAIEAASPGDTVLVAPGVYLETIDFRGKDIVVTSTDGAARTTIDARRRGTVVTFYNGEGPGAVLSGFTLTGGLGPPESPGAIGCFRSEPTVVDCVITDCTGGMYGDMWLDAAGAGAIDCRGFNSEGLVFAPTFERCEITGNRGGSGEDSAQGGPGALRFDRATAPRFRDCRIEHNAGGLARGGFLASAGHGAVLSIDAHPVFERCQIRFNRGGDATLAFYREPGAGGLEIRRGSATLVDCLVVGNEGGLVAGAGPDARGVGGMSAWQADLTMTGTVLASNVGGIGGAIVTAVDVSGVAVLTNCTFVGNQGSLLGGLSLRTVVPVTITNTILWGNELLDGSASDLYARRARPELTYCVVTNATPGAGNIARDPALVDIAGGDYHLQATSPCIEAGTLGVRNLPPFDLDGDRRPIGPAIDIGADELDHTPVAYCRSTPNSTGAAATMGADGVPSVFQNAFTLRASSVPDELGVFMVGAAPTQLPFGNGFLCVGGSLQSSPGLVGVQGELTWSPDLHARAVTAGQTWYTQAVFRDPLGGGAGFDSSDGLSVTFVP